LFSQCSRSAGEDNVIALSSKCVLNKQTKQAGAEVWFVSCELEMLLDAPSSRKYLRVQARSVSSLALLSEDVQLCKQSKTAPADIMH
jgi:hypothetical protein